MGSVILGTWSSTLSGLLRRYVALDNLPHEVQFLLEEMRIKEERINSQCQFFSSYIWAH